jgi:Domain of unknown function (DUF4340)
MSERLTNILGYLTLFAIMAAIWVMFGEDPSREQGARGERTFAGMEERINQVALVEIKQDSRVATIEKNGDVWRMQERSGYLVDTAKVREMLRGIAFSKRREPKTANPDRYERLGLGKDATHIELRDDTGGVILNFDMGKRKDTRDGRSLTYIAQARDTRSWLVTNIAQTPVNPGWWLKRPLLNIDQRRFSNVIIGGGWLTRKLGDTDFKIQSKRASEKAAGSWVLADPARVVSGLDFADVRAVTNPLTEPKSVVELSTHDGLSLTISLYQYEDGIWMQLAAEFDQALQNKGKGGTLPAAPADGVAEARVINAAIRGWLFKLNASDAEILQRTRADFLQTSTE